MSHLGLVSCLMPRAPILVALIALGCADLTMPSTSETRVQPAIPSPQPAAEAPSGAESPKPERQILERDDTISASHVLIAYQGSLRAREQVTRTKADARKLAQQVQAKAKNGEDFAGLAKTYSDDPSRGKGGELGSFGRNSMVKPFADAAFALKIDGVSDVVETDFGFHVIKRTK